MIDTEPTLGPEPAEAVQLWFEPAVRYEGQGHADFEDPHGFVEGPAWVEFDDSGVARGGLAVEKVVTDDPMPMGLHQLFQRDRPVAGEEPGSLVLSFGLDSKANDCIVLTVKTQSGTFMARSPIGLSFHHKGIIAQPGTTTLTFQLFNGVFLASQAAPWYWVLPLTNFASRYRPAAPDLAHHPLRLRAVPEIPEEGTWQERAIAQSRADRHNQLIVFDYKGRRAYIEPLLDQEDREQRLKEGRDRRLVTALMVGELPADVRTEEQVERYLPPDVLQLLSLASGSEVGAAWIELRDLAGGLVARIHSGYGDPQFASGHRAIDEMMHEGVGSLLSRGTKSDIFDSAMLRVVTKHVVRGALHGLTVEDRLSHLIRALDCLCRMLGINGHVSVTDLLTQKETGAVRKIVKHASAEVRRLSEEALRAGHYKSAGIYQDVAQRISNATKLQSGFGADVSELIRGRGLHHLEVVEAFFAAYPRDDGRDWLALLSYYRGLVMHNGYIDFDRNPTAWKDASALLDHLHDLLLRLMLKRLGYDGKYQPTVIKMTADYDLDWVKPDTPPHRLGYE